MVRISLKASCGVVILAGGLNIRMDGRNKALLELGGQTIVARLVERLREIFSQIVLVTREPAPYAQLPVKVVSDIYAARSSLTGIHAGICNLDAEYAFVVPCDTPFLQPALVDLLLDALAPGVDVVIPFFEGHFQPLCAIYSKRSLAAIESQLERDAFKIIDIFDQLEVRTVPLEKLKIADPHMLSFFNVNTPADFQVCKQLFYQHG